MVEVEGLIQKYYMAVRIHDFHEAETIYKSLYHGTFTEVSVRNDFINTQIYFMIYCAIRHLQYGRTSAARSILSIMTDEGCDSWPFLWLLRGAALLPDVPQKASEALIRYLEKTPDDENAWFLLGNSMTYYAGLDAVTAYEEALKRKASFAEAMYNMEAIKRQKPIISVPYISRLYMNDWKNGYYHIPIFINVRDRVNCLKGLVNYLLSCGYDNIIILDNDSTYKPLLDYYNDLPNDCLLVKLGVNMGHTALWDSGILEKMNIMTPYVYTDPDVIPVSECPKNFMKELLDILCDNPLMDKVGLGLVYEDVTYYDRDACHSREKKFYDYPISDNVYFAPVDTTFALYANIRHYSRRMSLRTGGNLRIRHLPWYYDVDNMPDDEKYYLEHANSSSSLGEHLKRGKT